MPDQMRGHLIEAEHLVRYKWASAFVSGARVLDAGCGVAYGTSMLAGSGANEVIGADIAAAVLDAVRPDMPENARLEVGDVLDLRYEDGAFDVVVCFDCIEHLADPGVALDELARVLAPTGLLLVSSPNRDVQPSIDPHHHHEFVTRKLAEEVGTRFRNVRLVCQQDYVASAILTDEAFTAAISEPLDELRLYKTVEGSAGHQTFTIALASDGPLPAPPMLGMVTTTVDLNEVFTFCQGQADELQRHKQYIIELEQRMLDDREIRQRLIEAEDKTSDSNALTEARDEIRGLNGTTGRHPAGSGRGLELTELAPDCCAASSQASAGPLELGTAGRRVARLWRNRGQLPAMGVESSGVLLGEDIELSVVVPVYGCEECLVALHERLTRTMSRVTGRYELVFVDDRSVDAGWEVLKQLARSDPRVRAFRLSRNFGEAAAVTAGLTQARGAWAVVMDCDLQEAPEDIPRLWAAAAQGYDLVRTRRKQWRHSRFRRWTSRVYRNLTQETQARADYSSFTLLSRRVIDAFLKLNDRDREFMIVLNWLGFDSTTVEIEHHERHAGDSAYGLQRLIRVALHGMFFRSTVLLRLVVLIGFVIALIGFGVAGYEIIDYFVEPAKRFPGFTTLAVLMLVLAGVIIFSVGIVGLYVGRVFEQVKDRPLFLIDKEAEGRTHAVPRDLPESEMRSAHPSGSAPLADQVSSR